MNIFDMNPNIAGNPNNRQGAASGFGQMPNPQGYLNQYQSAYNQALEMNQANYTNMLNAYHEQMANIAGQQQTINAGYGTLQSNVMGQIEGVDASQRQAIQDTYAQQTGQAQQGLINSGLGNTTVQSSINRGLTLDAQKAQIALSNQMAQLRAGYTAQIGQAQLGSAQQAVGMETQLTGGALGHIGQQYQMPQAGAYGAAMGASASMYGQQLNYSLGQQQIAAQLAAAMMNRRGQQQQQQPQRGGMGQPSGEDPLAWENAGGVYPGDAAFANPYADTSGLPAGFDAYGNVNAGMGGYSSSGGDFSA